MKSLTRSLGVLLFLPSCMAADEVVSSSAADPILEYPSNRSEIDYSGSVTGLYYGGGEILTSTPTNLYLIFYGSHWTTSAKAILQDFATGLDGAPMASVLTTFTDGAGNRGSSSFKLAGSVTISSYTHGTTLADSDIVGIVHDAIAGSLPDDTHGIYVVYSDHGAGTNNGGSCTCGHHFSTTGGHKIAQMDSPGWCTSIDPTDTFCAYPYATSPNGDKHVEEMASVTWHEIAEAVSDPSGGGYRTKWVAGTSTSGETEIGDLCGRALHIDDGSNPPVANLQLDRNYTTANGGTANVHLGARDFLMQPIWQNADRGGCARRLGFARPAWSSTHPAGDLDGNGIADIMWRDSASGTVTAWMLDSGNFVTSSGTTRAPLPEDWQIYGFGRFNSGARNDVLIRNIQTGEIRIWIMNGYTVASVVNLVTPSSQWLVKGVGDFDGDGYADILFQSMTTNATRVWYNNAAANGGTPVAFTMSSLASTTPAASINDDSDTVGTGDFTGDGASDVLWFNLATGNYRHWSFSGTSVTSTVIDVAAYGCERVMGIADMDGDGTADLLCEMSGATQLGWVRMSAGHPVASTVIAAMPAPEWRYTGASIFGAAKQTGILWRNRVTGDLARWLIGPGGTSWSDVHIVNAVPQNWEVVSY
jgi:hypothetical protein